MHFKEQMALKYAELVYYGQWYSPLREALDAFFDCTQERVSGTVKLKLYKGNIMVMGRKSPYTLYNPRTGHIRRGCALRSERRRGVLSICLAFP